MFWCVSPLPGATSGVSTFCAPAEFRGSDAERSVSPLLSISSCRESYSAAEFLDRHPPFRGYNVISTFKI
jgi:hypothetical protein